MSSEVVATTSTTPPASFEAALEAERAAEQKLMRSIMKSVAIGVPLGIAFFIVLLTIAVAGQTEWYVIVGLGSIMGVLGAVLFGMLGGVTLVAHVLEDVDRGTPAH
jgi:uncharacterized membrane protein